ncbi:class F sortase [Streptomyces indicus]|uniref:LPXTG-site transpeptidase (Sortase) family protein n=1 Tax=Streptomyces indicus TaxID=417292 RepID=A0A1G8WKY7_9ACTN|nr:class F sortase [Streptomyces indicus]SDJ78260.1 LPXTG-site transpeptidase (sortase) family protein [Streptomyces indicus]
MTTPTLPRTPRRATRIAAASVLTVSLGAGLMACGQGAQPGPDVKVANTATAQAKQAAQAMQRSKPTGLKIESAGVDATSMLDLTTDSTGELQVPPADKAELPGWWQDGPTPGEKGASVLVAHYDTAKGPALMKNVKDIKIGDAVEVKRADGTTAHFKVREIEQVNKKDFPTNKVYGETNRAELRILTCGGGLKDGHRTDNIILYADLVQ